MQFWKKVYNNSCSKTACCVQFAFNIEHPGSSLAPIRIQTPLLPYLSKVLQFKSDHGPDKDCTGAVWSAPQSEVLLSCSFCVLIFPPTFLLAVRVDLFSFLLVISRIREKKSVMWAACTCVSPANCQWHPKGKSNRRLISASFLSVFHIILCLYSIQSMPHSAWSVLLKDTFNYSMCPGWIQISVLNFKSVLVLAEGSFTSSSFFYSLFVVFNSVFRTMHYGFCPFYCCSHH